MYEEEEELEVESKSIDEDTLAAWVKKGKELCAVGEFDQAEELFNRAAAFGYEPAHFALAELENKHTKFEEARRKEAEKAFIADAVIDGDVLKKYNGSGGDVVIPDSVTIIGGCAFLGCKGLTSVKIHNRVSRIEYSAFKNCSSLTSIEIPDSVKSIEGGAFSGCSSLTNIDLPRFLTEIEYETFYYCSNLTGIDIPSGITDIGRMAFANCDKLTKLNLPNGLQSIGECAFNYCHSLTSISIPQSVTYIGRAVFDGCDGLTSVTVDSDNTTYHSAGNCIILTDGYQLVVGCQNSVVPDDGSVTSIAFHAFGYCHGLERIDIPDSVTEIESTAFTDCSMLTEITIPNSITRIELQTFWGCRKLSRLFIPSSVVSIGYGAFAYCESLTDITFGGTRKQWKKAVDKRVMFFYEKAKHTCVVHCSDGDITIKAGIW